MEVTLQRPLPDGIGRVSQWFGENPDWYAKFGMAGHPGIDYAVPVGTPVLAAHAGRCTIGDDPTGYGTFIRITSFDDDMQTLYGHLNAVLVTQGERVERGQSIGNSGDTGNSTGPHVHWGLKLLKGRNPAYRDWVDPAPWR